MIKNFDVSLDNAFKVICRIYRFFAIFTDIFDVIS